MSRRVQTDKGTSALKVVIFSKQIALFGPFTIWTSQAMYGLATTPSYRATEVEYTSEFGGYE